MTQAENIRRGAQAVNLREQRCAKCGSEDGYHAKGAYRGWRCRTCVAASGRTPKRKDSTRAYNARRWEDPAHKAERSARKRAKRLLGTGSRWREVLNERERAMLGKDVV